MRRPSDGDDEPEHGASLESRAEEFAQQFLARSRKLVLIGTILLALLVIIALVTSKLSG